MSCETPFSTENVCVVVPVNQREVSVQASQMHVRISVTVHAEELRPCTRYVFLVLAVRISMALNHLQAKLTESVKARHNASLRRPEGIIVEAVLAIPVHDG